MAGDASRALGAPELAGVLVNPKGLTKKMTTAVAGGSWEEPSGRWPRTRRPGRRLSGRPDVPDFGRVGYVAVTEVALVKTDTGMLKMKISDTVLARAPPVRDRVRRARQGALCCPTMKIAFQNGAVWEFDVPKVSKKSAEKVVRVLGGTID